MRDHADSLFLLAWRSAHLTAANMQNVATLSLESPYYGARKPPAQRGSKLQRVSDLLMLGRATIEESLFLLAWAQRQGFARLGGARASIFYALSCYLDAPKNVDIVVCMHA